MESNEAILEKFLYGYHSQVLENLSSSFLAFRKPVYTALARCYQLASNAKIIECESTPHGLIKQLDEDLLNIFFTALPTIESCKPNIKEIGTLNENKTNIVQCINDKLKDTYTASVKSRVEHYIQLANRIK
jgi:hypothetical protein